MYDIDIARGDTFSIEIVIVDSDGEYYELESGDTLVFGVKQNVENTDCDIKKELTASDKGDTGYILTIDHSDTLDLEFARYYYDVVLHKSDGTYKTVIPCSCFNVCRSVSCSVGEGE